MLWRCALVLGWWITTGARLTIGADTWPQFRGPDGQGHAGMHGVPLSWSETENILWKTPILGEGWSSPVVADGRVWLTAARDAGRSLRAVCVELETGRILLDREVFAIEQPEHVNAKNSHASPTPIIEAGRVYVHFGTNGTACLDARDGATVWVNREQRLDHKEGPGSSPILYENLLIFHCDGMDVQYVVALDAQTGKMVWRTNRPSLEGHAPDQRKAYTTPLIVRVGEHDELISPGAQRVVGYDPRTGRQLWQVNYQGFSNVARPVVADDLVLINTGYTRPQLLGVRPGGSGDVTASHVVWKVDKAVTRNPSPLVVDGRVYMIEDKGIATCHDAKSGNVLWTERIGGNFTASPVVVDGRIYVSAEDGLTHVLGPGETFHKLAENKLEGRIQASPAVVGATLLLRTDQALYRIGRRS